MVNLSDQLPQLPIHLDSPDFIWDRRSGRYRYGDSGKFVPREAMLNLQRGYVETIKADFQTLGGLLADGKISLRTWQETTAKTIKTLHTNQAILGRGGVDRMTSADYLAVGRELRSQYKYLQQFATDLTKGTMTRAQFEQRLKLYANSSNISFSQTQQQNSKDNGDRYMRRRLHASESCPDCILYAARGVVAIGSLPLPKQNCQCGANCRCTVEYSNAAM
ncbi:MAG: hypothetical protein KME13_25330 [Myxacorys californica WJT36-NPBG1]|jgi:hypothetical protein|nr:hypothetical protein [Myxacorys californica WJT36-NPBG1]